MDTVHYCDYAQQPDIRIACDQTWTTPAWGEAETETPKIYRADDRRLYTFLPALVTCAGCQAKVSP